MSVGIYFVPAFAIYHFVLTFRIRTSFFQNSSIERLSEHKESYNDVTQPSVETGSAFACALPAGKPPPGVLVGGPGPEGKGRSGP